MSFKGPVSLKTRLALEFAEVPIVGQIPIGRYLRARYGDRVVTPAKVANFVRTKRDLLRRSVSVESLPTILNLDTFNACNLKCPFCATVLRATDEKCPSCERAKAKEDRRFLVLEGGTRFHFPKRVPKKFVGTRSEMVERPALPQHLGELRDADEIRRLRFERRPATDPCCWIRGPHCR